MPFHLLHQLLCDTDPSTAAAADHWPDDHSLLRWISADPDFDEAVNINNSNASFGILDQPDPASSFGLVDGNFMFEEKPAPPQMVVPQFLQFAAAAEEEQQQQQQPKRHNSGSSHCNSDAVLVEHLYKAAEAVSAGNSPLAHQILARLNHHLMLTPAAALHRAASHVATALLRVDSGAAPPPSPSDTVFKMAAHKLFSEVSPLTHFLNFTAAQALLDSLSSASSIHVFDFDIGFGDHWASFLQDLPLPRPSVTITAFASPATHHPLHLSLLRHTLSAFAADLAVPFRLHLHDSAASLPLPPRSAGLVAAVNFPLRAPPPLLRVLGHLAPDIVVSAERPSDLPYPQRVVHALHAHAALLESLEAGGAAPDAVHMIQKFLLQPRIEAALLLQHHTSTPSAAGLAPATFSQLAEAQAECVVKRAPARGFHVEKRGQSSLALCWQRRELVSVSAWRRCSST